MVDRQGSSLRVVLAVLVVFSAFAGTAYAIELAPHRAFYSMKLGAMRAAAGIIGASGAMYMEWAESCEGWTLTQRIRLKLSNIENRIVETDSSFSSWESKDGLSYRFTVRNMRDGTVIDDLRGRASLERSGMGGVAAFTRPEGKKLHLPKGAVFPTEHVAQLIDRAQAGDKRMSRIVFDGSSLDGPFEVNAVIGPALEAKGEGAGGKALTSRPSWRMRLAFFPVQSSAPEPDYELGVRLFDNGVAGDLVLDYGDFTLLATLERIEALAKPAC